MPLIWVGAVWLATNLLHGLWVGLRRRAWEKRAHRGPSGLLPDAAAYRIGNGPVALLFIHGFADSPCIWRRMTRRLAEGERFTCRAMRLLPAEAIVAATLNAACAIGRGDAIGSLEAGKQADAILLDMPRYPGLAYRFGTNPVALVVKRGAVVWPA